MRSTKTGSLLLTAMIMVLLVLTAAIPVSALYYWEQVSEEGFGDLSNDYAWSMAVYKPPGESTEYLYVGTLNTQYSEPPNLINDGCEVWRTDGTIVEGKYVWEQVVGPNGTQLMIHPINGSIIPATAGFRNGIPGIQGMVVYDGLLWAGCLSRISGAQIPTTGTIWVTNGTHWKRANIPGFGDGVASIRGMAVFNDELYVGTLKTKGGVGASIYKYSGDPIGGDLNAVNASAWTEVFSVAANEAWWFGVLKEFNGYLYAFSGYAVGLIAGSSSTQGCEIYRSSDGTSWEEVVGDAPEASMPRGFGDNCNDFILSAAVFQDKLYAGTKNFEDIAEIWRTSDGLNWEPVEQYGFGRQNRYIWRMIVYNDTLIAGTFNALSGCELWMSETGDPGTFEQININGMDGSMTLIPTIGNMSISGVPLADQYGVRSVANYQGYLVAGTATWADLFLDNVLYYQTRGKWHNLSGYVGCEIWRTDGTTYDIPPKNLDVIKTVWDPEAQAWVQELDVFVNDTVRFRCEIRNIGPSNLTDIVVWNELSRNLKYADRATIDPARINASIGGRTTLEWDISDLSPGENIAIEYDTNVTNYVSKDLNFLFARGWSKDHWDTDWDMVIVNSTAISYNAARIARNTVDDKEEMGIEAIPECT